MLQPPLGSGSGGGGLPHGAHHVSALEMQMGIRPRGPVSLTLDPTPLTLMLILALGPEPQLETEDQPLVQPLPLPQPLMSYLMLTDQSSVSCACLSNLTTHRNAASGMCIVASSAGATRICRQLVNDIIIPDGRPCQSHT